MLRKLHLRSVRFTLSTAQRREEDIMQQPFMLCPLMTLPEAPAPVPDLTPRLYVELRLTILVGASAALALTPTFVIAPQPLLDFTGVNGARSM